MIEEKIEKHLRVTLDESRRRVAMKNRAPGVKLKKGLDIRKQLAKLENDVPKYHRDQIDKLTDHVTQMEIGQDLANIALLREGLSPADADTREDVLDRGEDFMNGAVNTPDGRKINAILDKVQRAFDMLESVADDIERF